MLYKLIYNLLWNNTKSYLFHSCDIWDLKKKSISWSISWKNPKNPGFLGKNPKNPKNPGFFGLFQNLGFFCQHCDSWARNLTLIRFVCYWKRPPSPSYSRYKSIVSLKGFNTKKCFTRRGRDEWLSVFL